MFYINVIQVFFTFNINVKEKYTVIIHFECKFK